MILTRFVFAIILFTGLIPATGKPLPTGGKALLSPPARIIRTCCSFGADLRVTGIPVKKVTHITSLANLGPHKYLGGAQEGNGIFIPAGVALLTWAICATRPTGRLTCTA